MSNRTWEPTEGKEYTGVSLIRGYRTREPLPDGLSNALLTILGAIEGQDVTPKIRPEVWETWDVGGKGLLQWWHWVEDEEPARLRVWCPRGTLPRLQGVMQGTICAISYSNCGRWACLEMDGLGASERVSNSAWQPDLWAQVVRVGVGRYRSLFDGLE